MARIGIGRIFLSLAIAIGACAAAFAADAALPAALITLVGGALAATVVGGAFLAEEVRARQEPPPVDASTFAREIIAALAEPMLLLRNGRVVAANEAARALLGHWIEGQDVRLALRHPATVERLSRPDAGMRAVERVEVLGIGQPERRWLMTIAPLDDGYRLVHLADRSEQAAAEQMRVDFVANASHELRTPLATILGFIETLHDDTAAEDKDLRIRFLGIMNDEARRMQQLIEDLMSLSRIEAERFSPPRQPVALCPLVEEVRAGAAHVLADKGSTLDVDDRSPGARVPGDRGQLLQLIRNLVVNAVKYGRPGGAVTVRIEADGEDMVRLIVIDRGDGIAPEHLPRLTERFYRVDPGRSRAEGGTGLGLAIVKHIVGRHRGRLDIRSKQGEGTAVHVILPRAVEEADAVTSESS
jgi:two-component system phosphate regulon sensor histidine kinase PhoR